jgi:general secretion pathway protein G
MRRQKRSGFTLFEVLLVIAILALLAAFVIPEVMKTGNKAKIDMAANAIGPTGPFATALKLYRLHMGRFPEGEDGLRMLLEPPDSGDEEEEKKWQGPYIESENMLNDPWGNEYHYRFPGEINEDTYEMWSDGPDEEDGTEDDVKTWSDDE